MILYVFVFIQSQVFAVAFALLATGAVILTLNVLLLVIFPYTQIDHTPYIHTHTHIHTYAYTRLCDY